MRKIISALFVSLDGVVEAPETWHFPYFSNEMGAAVFGQMAAADTMLLGRRTYEVFAASWGHRSSDFPFTDMINGMPKLVASNTMTSADWQNSTLITGDLGAALGEIKAGDGGNITVPGSIKLVRSLLKMGLLDELRLMIHPIVLGSGIRLFEDGIGRHLFVLKQSETFATGVLNLTYTRADARSARQELASAGHQRT